MNNDIYSTIGLYLPVPSILNFFLAKKLNREYFWKARLEQDYSLNNPLKLSYQELYKRHYQYTPGNAKHYVIPMPRISTFSNTYIPGKSIEPELIKLLAFTPKNGDIITYTDVDLGITARRYIYHNCQLFWLYAGSQITIPDLFDMLEKYPINYFSSSDYQCIIRLNLSPYLEQIKSNTNQISANEDYSFKSKFVDWKGDIHIVNYNNLASITQPNFYIVSGNELSAGI
jgi:hypothetical protein